MKVESAKRFLFVMVITAGLICLGATYKSLMLDSSDNCSQTVNFTGAVKAQQLYSVTTGNGLYVGDSSNPVYHQGGKVDGVDVSAHTHSGAGEGGTVSHTSLSNKGTTTHAILDLFYGGDFKGVAPSNCGNITMNGTALVDGIDISAHDHTGAFNGQSISHTSLTSKGTATHAQLDAFYNGDHSGYNITNVGTVDGVDVSNAIVDNGTWTSVVDNQILRRDTAGKIAQGSSVYIADTGELYWNDGKYNQKIGLDALDNMDGTAVQNTGIGTSALTALESGDYNVAMGYSALFSSVADSNNTSVGRTSTYSLNGGHDNSAYGYNALFNSETGSYNSCFGSQAGIDIDSSTSDMVCIGYNSGSGNISGDASIYVGSQATAGNGDEDNAIVIGYNTVGMGDSTIVIGNANNVATYLYSNEVYLCEDPSGTLGDLNCSNVTASTITCDSVDGVDVGDHAADTTTAHGAVSTATANKLALRDAYAGIRANTFYLGTTEALRFYADDPGVYNTLFVGTAPAGVTIAGAALGAKYNTCVGYISANSLTNGYGNTVLGNTAAYNLTTGYYNTVLGFRAGRDNTSTVRLQTGYMNVLIGYQAYTNAESDYNEIAIGANVQGGGTNTVRIGNGQMTSIGGQVAWSTLSDKRAKENIEDSTLGLDFISRLSPKKFEYAGHEEKDGKKPKQYGLIAQDLRTAMADAGASDFSALDDTNPDMLAIRYDNLIAPLINAVKELKAENDALKARLEKLEAK